MKKLFGLIFAVALVVMFLPELAQACPNCKEAYTADGGTSIASGYGASILFMMAMPFLVIGGFVLRLWMARRSENRPAVRP